MKAGTRTEKRTFTPGAFAKVLLPLLLLAGGIIGYTRLSGQPAGIRPESASATVSRRMRGASHGPRYGHGGANWRARGQRSAPLVETRRARLTEWRPRMTFYGRIVAPHRVELRPPVSGRVIMTNPRFRVGGEVKKGEILLRLDDFAYRSALAQAEAALEEMRASARESEALIALERDSLEVARQQLELARRDLDRMRRLAGNGTVSDKALDAAILTESQRRLTVLQKRRAIDTARARLAQTKARIRRQRELVKVARRNLADTVVRAPFDARVLSVEVAVGQYVTPSDGLAVLADASALEVRFSMTEDQYGDLLALGGTPAGAPVRIVWKSGLAQFDLSGVVERIAPEVDSASGMVTVFASLDADAALLRKVPLGAFADVSLMAPGGRKVVRLPEGALHEGERVFVVLGDVLRPRRVRPLARENGEVIVAGGLENGEEVLVSPLPNASAGMRVRKVEQ